MASGIGFSASYHTVVYQRIMEVWPFLVDNG